MIGRLSIVLVLAFAAWAANVKLYLKDGGYHLVREYQVQPDRVRFYSVERSEWEEIPLELVDLKRTEAEAAARNAALEKEAKIISEEEKAEREVENEVRKIPQEPGVYWVEGGQTKTLKQAESTVHSDKGRSILKRLVPMPAVSGKATLELNGTSSETVFTKPEPEFYFQLSQIEQFGIAKLTVKGTVRIVEDITTRPRPGAGARPRGSAHPGSHPATRGCRRSVQDLAQGPAGPGRVCGHRIYPGQAQHADLGLRGKAKVESGAGRSGRGRFFKAGWTPGPQEPARGEDCHGRRRQRAA